MSRSRALARSPRPIDHSISRLDTRRYAHPPSLELSNARTQTRTQTAMDASQHMLLASGSLRAASTNTAVLRTVQALVPDGLTAVLSDGIETLPHFNADDDAERRPAPSAVAGLRAQIAAADAVLFSTPEYAGALPGSFKNLIDWTVGGDQMYRKPVAWINTSSRGASNAHHPLRKVLGYLSADIVEAACVQILVTGDAIGLDGLIADPQIRRRAIEVPTTLRQHPSKHRSPTRAINARSPTRRQK